MCVIVCPSLLSPLSVYLSNYHPSSSLLLFPAIFPNWSPSSRVCISPAPTCQPEVSPPCLPCHQSCGSCCASVWGRWRASSSGRWPIWRRRRASSTMKQRPTANAPRALSTPSWRGSPSSRKVSVIQWVLRNVGQIYNARLFSFFFNARFRTN